MDALPNLTKPDGVTDVKPESGQLDWRYQNYIDYCAVGGLIITDDGNAKRLNMDDFAAQLGVTRQTLHNWKRSIPDFNQRVEDARSKLFQGSRMTAVWNGQMLAAMKGNSQAAALVLSHFGKYRPPAQRIEQDIKVSGFADLLTQAAKENILDVTDDGSGTFTVNPGSRPDHAILPS